MAAVEYVYVEDITEYYDSDGNYVDSSSESVFQASKYTNITYSYCSEAISTSATALD